MKNFLLFNLSVLFLFGCKTSEISGPQIEDSAPSDLIIAIGSCNKQYLQNILWDDVLANNPKVWVWGGDNIYGDTQDMQLLQNKYENQNIQKGYAAIKKNMRVLGTWDDHDYGLNDTGEEFPKKKESQQLFLDFFDVPEDSPRRNREGIYHSEIIRTEKGSVKIIVLDTRYFRTALNYSKERRKRYQANKYGDGTILGEKQWNWLKNELAETDTDFTIILSSIQFLSRQHGFETWGNFPHEIDKMNQLLKASKARNVIFISGDRHISEFSKANIDGLAYPLVEFTSSGMTHSYSAFKGEPNQYRFGNVVSDLSFGLLKFNFKTKTVTMQMRGDKNILQQELIQSY